MGKSKHEIHTGNNPHIRQAICRLPPHCMQEAKRHLGSMLDQVIQPSKSPWASLIVPVHKKDNSLRLCVDYCKLNEMTHKDANPFPYIDDTLNISDRLNWFSQLICSVGTSR